MPRSALCPWLSEKAGHLLIQKEQSLLSQILPRLFGYHLVQLGNPDLKAHFEASLIHHKIQVSTKGYSGDVCCDFNLLPFKDKSLDVIVLPHVLEATNNPHEVLKECIRCLIPGGHLVIVGFNPLGLWTIPHRLKQGLKGLILRHKEGLNFISLFRIKDWLKLLDLSIVDTQPFFFRPPWHGRIYERLAFVDRFGPRFWPFLAGAYILVATKQEISLTPIRERFSRRAPFFEKGLPKATVRNPQAME